MSDLCLQQEKKLLSLDETLTAIRASISPITGTESVELSAAAGRILAHPVLSPIDLPQYDNSAMDGYALSSRDIDTEKPFLLNAVGTSWAGRPYTGTLRPGQCVRIFTGAVIPATLDTVVMQEQVNKNEKVIEFPAGIQTRQNVRLAGEDIAKSDGLLQAPKRLTPADIALLAATGIERIDVLRKIKIAFLSTGDELRPVGHSLQAGQIYDSNRHLLNAFLQNEAWSATDLGIAADDENRLEQIMNQAAQSHDLMITTGGASVGEADFITKILNRRARARLWKMAVKPGKPFAFGQIGSCSFFGLPGNPVAVFVSFQQIVLPALHHMAGLPETKRLGLRAICRSTIKKTPGRQEFIRGILGQSENGTLEVRTAGKQGSHILSSLSRANCFIVLPQESTGVTPGDMVTVETFHPF